MMADLNFDESSAFAGTYTASGVTYDVYRVTYCAKPISGLDWSGVPSDEFFKMNIKVPKGLTAQEKKTAQILYYNPWGGDYGQPAAKPEELDNPLKVSVLKAGWILIEPGMRGTNCFTGTPGQPDYHHWGKLPRPLADLKAGIRYLRFGANAENIPGDKDRIWIAGVSSGGCASSIVGTSGDSELFMPYLEEIGAAGTGEWKAPGKSDGSTAISDCGAAISDGSTAISDAVFGAMPSCPVMNRGNLDAALAWERWSTQNIADDPQAEPFNVGLVKYYEEYLNGLGLSAERDVPEAGIHRGDSLNAGNMNAYDWVYVKEAGRKFFGKMSAEEIGNYLAEPKKADPMYGTPETDRKWIRPLMGKDGKTADFDGSYEDFWRYTVGDDRMNSEEMINWQCDGALAAPDEVYEGSGILNIRAGIGFDAKWSNLSTPSFGKPGDIGAVFSKFGQEWLEKKRGMKITEEYRELIAMQRNSVDPMYFIMEDRKAKTAKRWFLRTGTVDQVTPHPNFIALGTALLNHGAEVDMAFVWDEVHGLTSEIAEFMDFSERE